MHVKVMENKERLKNSNWRKAKRNSNEMQLRTLDGRWRRDIRGKVCDL